MKYIKYALIALVAVGLLGAVADAAPLRVKNRGGIIVKDSVRIIEGENANGTQVFSVDDEGNAYLAGDCAITGDLAVGGVISYTSTATNLVNQGSLSCTTVFTANGDCFFEADATCTSTITAADAVTTDDLTVGDDAGITGKLTVGETSTLVGNTAVSGTLYAGGNATLGGTLGVTSNATVGGTLGVTGASTLVGNTAVSGTFHATGNSTVGGTFGVTSNATVGGTFKATGASTLVGNTAVSGTVYAGGAVTGGTTIAATGNLTGGDVISLDDHFVADDSHVSGLCRIGETLFVGGAATLVGNSAVTGTLYVGGTLTGAGTITSADGAFTDDLFVTDDTHITGLATIGETLGVTGLITASAGVKDGRTATAISSATTATLTTAQCDNGFLTIGDACELVVPSSFTASLTGYEFTCATTAGTATITIEGGSGGGGTSHDVITLEAYESVTIFCPADAVRIRGGYGYAVN